MKIIEWCLRHYWKIIGVMLFIILVIGPMVGCTPAPLTQEQQWVRDMDSKCRDSRSRGTYIKETKTYECWNRPYFRRPRITFTEKYI